MNVYLLDDEAPALKTLEFILSVNFPEITIVGKNQNIESALIEVPLLNIDIVFLDIELGTGTGFDFLSRLDIINFEVIFVTAHDEYAIKAIKNQALDYILKPINASELKIAISNYLKKSNSIQHLKTQVNAIEKNNSKRIILNHSGNIDVVKISDIAYIEADGSYCLIHCSHKKITYTKNLSELEKNLPENQFIRIHKSFLVNKDYIKNDGLINKKNVALINGIKLPIARRRWNLINLFFGNNLGE